MCKRRVKESFFVFTFVVVFGMTPLSFADQTSIGENPNKPLTQEIKDETVDVSQTIKNYTIKQRDEAVKNAKAGQVQYRTDKAGIIHSTIGRASFDVNQLKQNLSALVDALNKARPASAKGVYLRKAAISSTMGGGAKVEVATLTAAATE